MKPEPEQLEYTKAMLPGLLLGGLLYWVTFCAVLLCVAIVRGKPVLDLVTVAACGLVVVPALVFFVGFLVRIILCTLNQLLGKPVGCSNLAACVSGLTHYLLTAWVPLIYLLHKQDAFLFLLTALLGPILGMTCGSVAVRQYERKQRTYVPYPRSQFQFQLRHLFTLTIIAAILLVASRSLANYQWLIFPFGYCLFQITILLILNWLPPVKYIQNDNLIRSRDTP